MIIEKQLNINNRKKADLIAELEKLRFPKFGKDGIPVYAQEQEDEAEISVVLEEFEEAVGENVAIDTVDVNAPSLATYEYLLGMPIWSLTRERYEKLLQQRGNKETELNSLLKLSAKDLWNNDLDDFEVGWREFLADDTEKREGVILQSKSKGKKKVTRKKKDDDDDFQPGSKKSKAVSSTKGVVKAENKPGNQSTLPFVKSEVARAEPEKKASIFGSGGIFQSFIDGTSPVSKKMKKDKFQLDPEDLESDLSGFVDTSSQTNDNKDSQSFGMPENTAELDYHNENTVSSIAKTKAAAKSNTAATAKQRKPAKKPASKAVALESDDEGTPSPLVVKKTTRVARATTKKLYKMELSDSEADSSMEAEPTDDEASFDDFDSE
jgi:DNA topoisomerase II